MDIKNLKISITNWFNRLKQNGNHFISQAKKRAQRVKDSYPLAQILIGAGLIALTGAYILLVILRLFGSSQGIPLKRIGIILLSCWISYGLIFKKTRAKTVKLSFILVVIGGIGWCLIQSPTSFINSWAVVISWIVALGLCFYIMCVGKASWRWPIFLTLLGFSLFIRLFIGAITPSGDIGKVERTACFSTAFTGTELAPLPQDLEDDSSTSEIQPNNLPLLEENWLQLFNAEHLENFTFLQSLWEAIFKTGQLLMWGDNAPAFVECGREALNLYGVQKVWINAFVLFTSFANTMIPLSFTGFLIDVLLWFLPELRIWVLPFGAIRFVFGAPTEENLLLGETIKEALEDERGFKIVKDYLCTPSTPLQDQPQNQVLPKPPKLWFKNLRVQFIYTDWNLNRKSKNYLRAKNMGAICTSKSVSKLSLRHSKRLAYFLCDEHTSENFAILEKLSHKSHGKYLYAPYKTKVYIFAENPGWEDTLKTFKYNLITKGNKTLEIQIIKDYATLPMQLMEKVPLFAPLLPNDCPKTNRGKKILSVLVIGSASQAAEYIKTVFWAGQMNKVDLRITAIGLSAEKIKDKLIRKCPEILRSCEADHPLLNYGLKNGLKKCNSPYANIRFVSTKDITRCPPELLKEAEQANYIICALNSDEENAHLALDLKRLLTYPTIQDETKNQPAKIEEKPQKSTAQPINGEFKLRIIVPIIKQNLTESLRHPTPKFDDSSFSQKCISPNMKSTLEDSIIIAPFGLDKERYSLKSMLRLDLYRYWRASDKIYHQLQGQVNGKCDVNNSMTPLSLADLEYRIWNNEYGDWNNWARSIHALYKVFDLGLIEKIKFSPEGLDAFVDAKKATPDYIKRLVKNEAKDGHLLQNLTWIEHRRWVAFTRSLGYTHLDSANFEFLSPGKTHFPSFKAHACLCESDWKLALPSILREPALQGDKDQLDEIGQELIDTYKKHHNWKESEVKEISGHNKYFDLPFLDMRLSTLICFDATGKGDCNGLYKMAQKVYGEDLFPSDVLSEEMDIV